MHTFEWAIEDIIAAHPDLYLEHCAVMAVALMSQQSASPYEFMVECEGFRPPALGSDTTFRLRVSWTEHTARKAQRIRHTEASAGEGGGRMVVYGNQGTVAHVDRSTHPHPGECSEF